MNCNIENDTFDLPPSEQQPLVHRRAKRTKETVRARFKNETSEVQIEWRVIFI
jgi:hypothetical protein